MSLNTADLPELGVSLIDQQHRHYVLLVARTLTSTESGELGKEEIEGLLDELMEYCIEHFDAEGYLMRTTDYPRAADHEGEHETFRRNIEILTEQFLEDVDIDVLVVGLRKVLIEWFQAHVRFADADLATFLIDSGHESVSG